MTLTDQERFHTFLQEAFQQADLADALQKVRAKAWDHYLELGLPSRDTEVYRYIKLGAIFGRSYTPAQATKLSAQAIAPHVLPECHGSCLVFVNGHYQPDLSLLKNVPSKVVVSLLTDATRTYGAFLNNQWAKGMKEETDPFAAFNAALHQNGAFLYIPPRTVLEVPIQILHLVDSADGILVMPRIHVSLGIQADAKFVFKTTLLNTTHYGINQVAEFALDEGARADITQVVENEANTGWHLDALRGQLKRDSRLHCVALTKGSLTTRFDYRVGLGGENGEALLQGLWTLSEKREAHIHVLIDHQAPYCRSNQLFKGVLSDFSRSSFEGKIMVRQAAQKTEAFQLNNNLLLSERANADSKPNLEIFADDVKASHGATIGQLDSEQLFYLKTRGLHDQVAKTLLIEGFCKEVTDLVGVPSALN